MRNRRHQLHLAYVQVYSLECACARAAAVLDQTKDQYDLLVQELPLPTQWALHNRLDMIGKAVLGICDDMVEVHAAVGSKRHPRPQPQVKVDALLRELDARLNDMKVTLDNARRIAR